uniref:Uncharacterized protein n=1 Tax=viral metagenome TaxID=1070528 RepID=A0A6C0I5A3_9ZZZZ
MNFFTRYDILGEKCKVNKDIDEVKNIKIGEGDITKVAKCVGYYIDKGYGPYARHKTLGKWKYLTSEEEMQWRDKKQVIGGGGKKKEKCQTKSKPKKNRNRKTKQNTQKGFPTLHL